MASNETDLAEWEGKSCSEHFVFNKIKWYQFMLIPAVCCVLALSFLHRRKNLHRHVCDGRPGLPRPLDFLDDKRNRGIYVVGMCVTAWMLQAITVDSMFFGIQPRGFETGGFDAFNRRRHERANGNESSADPVQSNSFPLAGTYWIRVMSSLLVAVICYPIFGGVSTEHPLGYSIGGVYVWAFTISYVMLNYPCERAFSSDADGYEKLDAVLKLLEFAPCFVCLSYLCLAYPYRLIAHFCFGLTKWKATNWKHEWPHLVYVRRLLAKPECTTDCPPIESAEGATMRTRSIEYLRERIRRIKYESVAGFRYSSSILSAIVVSILLVYTTMLTVMQLIVVADGRRDNSTYATYKFEYVHMGELRVIKKVSSMLFHPQVPRYAKYAIYMALIVSFVLTSSGLICTLVDHRRHLLDAYKGASGRLASYPRSHRGVMVDSLRYIGYQIAFAIAGFLAQTGILSAMMALLGLAIWIMVYHQEMTAPVVWIVILCLHTPCMYGLEHALVHAFFQLRDSHGRRTLGIDNRSSFVNLQYFTVFANTMSSLLACVLRVLMAIGFGLWTLPKLDRSVLPRQAERRDNGFAAYIGLVRLESAQRNPTALAFVHLLITTMDTDRTDVSSRRRRNVNRWLLVYTLLRNPGLQLQRRNGTAPRKRRRRKSCPPSASSSRIEETTISDQPTIKTERPSKSISD